ncbi:hypothetical protein N0V84_012351 [Fusarium piperis]|uniref:Uncharacterized protein n=1 Tax=Fusarium piperis TaxID=1435070 RepID=A0A9W8W3T4_9HYPO|nr:hypothetical protein N0V84_012351 [Fusarium piperis]
MPTVHDLILQHPTNIISNTGYQTASEKHWARVYHPISNIICHTRVHRGRTYADFERALLPLYDDDTIRLNHEAVPPNNRHWRLETEADCENWFNTEIVNVVLAAWFSNPAMTQSSHTKPLTDQNISENIDITFSIKIDNRRLPIAIGEIKRNLLDPDAWREGRAAELSHQRKLSQELRGLLL